MLENIPIKTATVVLFNLGGPDHPDSVRPFLFNLFFDKNIINLPTPIRFFLAKFIAKKREKFAQEVYAQIGGKSPILEETILQAAALKNSLEKNIPSIEWNVEIVMRYWHPRAIDIIEKINSEPLPEKIILLPLYPQFSTTTTNSSYEEWKFFAHQQSIDFILTTLIGCYYDHPLFLDAHVDLLLEEYKKAEQNGAPRILFSAHGLPEKIVHAGDPYPKQVEASVQKIVQKMEEKLRHPVDYSICYQSRVGRLKWIEPSTEEEIKRACSDKKIIVLTPIAFVSEHSETLVELDIEYKKLAEVHGAKHYHRVRTLRDHPLFIEALTDLCKKALPLTKPVLCENKNCCKGKRCANALSSN